MSGFSYSAPKAHGEWRDCERCGIAGIVGGGFYGTIAEVHQGPDVRLMYICKDGRECSLRLGRKRRREKNRSGR